MAKWTITVTETVTKRVDVIAESYESAIDCAENAPDKDFYGHHRVFSIITWDAPEAIHAEEIS